MEETKVDSSMSPRSFRVAGHQEQIECSFAIHAEVRCTIFRSPSQIGVREFASRLLVHQCVLIGIGSWCVCSHGSAPS